MFSAISSGYPTNLGLPGIAACLDVETNHSSSAKATRNVLECIFHGIVSQNTVALFVTLSMQIRSSASAFGLHIHKTVPSSVSSPSTKPCLRATFRNALSSSMATSVYAHSTIAGFIFQSFRSRSGNLTRWVSHQAREGNCENVEASTATVAQFTCAFLKTSF